MTFWSELKTSWFGTRVEGPALRKLADAMGIMDSEILNGELPAISSGIIDVIPTPHGRFRPIEFTEDGKILGELYIFRNAFYPVGDGDFGPTMTCGPWDEEYHRGLITMSPLITHYKPYQIDLTGGTH